MRKTEVKKMSVGFMLDLHTCRSFYHYKSDFCRLMKQTKLLGEFLWGESKEIVTKLLA